MIVVPLQERLTFNKLREFTLHGDEWCRNNFSDHHYYYYDFDRDRLYITNQADYTLFALKWL